MSADIAERIARLRRDAATHATVAPAYADDLRALLADYDEERAAREREWTKGRDAEADRDAQRTRAEAAEAEVARLRSLIDVTARDLVAAKASAEGWREEATGLRAAAPRTVPPTEAEAAAHNAALGWWLISREGVCPPAAVDAFRGDGDVAAYLPMARGATWLPLDRDGRPTAWPALDAAAPDVCECGHPVAMHRGADRCGAHGCGCDRDAKEAMWST